MKCRGGAISVAHVGMKTNMRKIKSDTQTAASEAAQTGLGNRLRWPQKLNLFQNIYFESAQTKNSINTELFGPNPSSLEARLS